LSCGSEHGTPGKLLTSSNELESLKQSPTLI
jgi:hypothetical protein